MDSLFIPEEHNLPQHPDPKENDKMVIKKLREELLKTQKAYLLERLHVINMQLEVVNMELLKMQGSEPNGEHPKSIK